MTAGHQRPPVLPRPVTGVFVRQIIHTACPGSFAVVWLDALPPAEDVLSDEGVEFVDDLPAVCHRPGEPLPAEFTEAFANGFRQGWRSRGRGVPPYTVRVVLRDAVWHENDSNHWSFEQAGRVAAREVLDCVREGRSPRPAGRPVRPGSSIPPLPRTLPSSTGSASA
ncbi:hypothetical protein KGD83_12330 [Nocardiopsis akebiae]|uniref:Translation elongation factor EFG/EF2 domain-containing protein n=1 Tax=Nocardiopsis akebiae TaxID=2831968 RepID=A0ABX8C9U6_9ACTN|nr:hypothetical protein [Nocardiopsis akebiae]QUX31201.1 hypothetical protein KGD83_12330 [Nocardiopsis akebiae]